MPRKSFPTRRPISLVAGLLLVCMAAGLVLLAVRGPTIPQPPQEDVDGNERFQPAGMLTLWWDRTPSAKPTTVLASHPASNIHPGDYIGPKACQECHQENYNAWSKHSHRWMNALADESTVKGDFRPGAMIAYLGGTARFFRDSK